MWLFLYITTASSDRAEIKSMKGICKCVYQTAGLSRVLWLQLFPSDWAQNTEDAESMEMQICVCLSLACVYTQILGSSKGCVLLFWPSASQSQSPRLNLNKVPGSGVTRTDPETWPRPTEHCALYSPARPSHSLPFPPFFSLFPFILM